MHTLLSLGLAVGSFGLASMGTSALADSGTWSSNASANWSDTTRWAGGIVADGAGFTAAFTNDITATRTVTLDSSRTIGNLTFTDSGSDWILSASGGSILTLDNLGGTSVFNTTSSGRTTTINLQLSSVVGHPGIVKNGAGTLVFTNALNNYEGTTTINAGTLRFNNAGAFAGTEVRNVTIANASTLGLAYAADQAALDRVDFSSAGLFALHAASGNALDFTGFGTLRLGASAAVTYSGALTSNGTEYRLGGGGQILTISTNLNEAVGLNMGLNGTGANTVLLTGVNAYSGNTLIEGGTLAIGATGGLANTPLITVNSGAVLSLAAADALHEAAVVNVSGTLALSAANALNLGATVNFAANTAVRLDAANALRQVQLDSLRFGNGSNTVQLNLNSAGVLTTSDGGNFSQNIFTGARVTVSNSAAIGAGQEVNLFAGSILESNNATITGAGTINRGSGSVIRISGGGSSFFGSQLTAASVGLGEVVQLNRNSGFNLGTLGQGAIIQIFAANRQITNATGGLTLNGQRLTNDNADRNIDNDSTAGRSLFVGANGLHIASSTGRTFSILEEFVTNGNPLTIGSYDPWIGVVRNGAVRLTNSASNLTNTTVQVGAGATFRGSATTTAASPFSTATIRVTAGTVRIDSGSTTANSASTIEHLETAGRTVLSVGRAATTFTTTANLNSALVRTNRGTLGLFTSNNTLGGVAAGSEQIFFVDPADAPARLTVAVGPTTIDMVAPWIVNASGTNTANFVDYDDTVGFHNVTYTDVADAAALGAAGAAAIVNVTTAFTNNDVVDVAALRTSQAISGAGTLNIGTGGLMVVSTTGRTIANAVNFGAQEGVVYVVGDSTGDVHAISGVVSGSAGLTKFGPAVLSLTNALNDFTGDVVVTQGLLNINAVDGALGNAANDVILNGGGLRTNTMSFTRDIILGEGGGTLDANTGQTMTVSTAVTGVGRLQKTGAGTVVLATANAYQGGTQIDAGVLRVSNDNQLGNVSGFLSLAGGTLQAGGDFSTSRNTYLTRIVNNAVTTSTIDTQANTVTLAGEILGEGNLIKTGTGDLILSRAGGNGYSGTTTVNEGRLLVNNTSFTGTGSGAVTVAAAGTLGGTGAISGAVTVNGTLAPGASAGTLDLYNALAFGDGSTFDVELGGLNPGDSVGTHDQVNLLSAGLGASIGANVTLDVSLIDGLTLNAGDAFYILTRADEGAYGNTFDGFAEGAIVQTFGSVDLTITYLADWLGSVGASSLTGGNDIALIAVAVPEPSTWTLMLAALGGVWFARRRK